MNDQLTQTVRKMPSLDSPFTREMQDGNYVVIDEVNDDRDKDDLDSHDFDDYSWVFEDDDVMAIEKLDGTNASILVQSGNITGVWGKERRVPPFNHGRQHITKGILNSVRRGYVDQLPDGHWFGEVIGPDINGNPHQVDEHLFIPFQTYGVKKLQYESWGKYPQTFDAISEWFREGLFSLFAVQYHNMTAEEASVANGTYCEGIVFTHPDGRMAKLRRDMFDWYEGERH